MAQAARNRIRPREALRAIGALIRNPDDTSQVFRIVGALSGNTGLRLYERFRRTPTGARILAERRDLLATLNDRDALLALPPGSLGHTYAEFMGREQISADGLVDASASAGKKDGPELPADRQLVGARLRDMHDLWHVVTGYQRDLMGEAALLAFTYAQTRHRGVGFIVLIAYWKSRGEMKYARRLIRQAYGRGRRAAWLPAQDWEALLARPLEAVRAELGIGDPPAYAQVRSEGAPAPA